jgi:hypothetical protein
LSDPAQAVSPITKNAARKMVTTRVSAAALVTDTLRTFACNVPIVTIGS